ncbi:MAG: GNAT family N-acetyltransferase [Actinobacteria bacterium]|nr:GNAT family N-acetyltransferase [Actinomycetota bacterium]
MRLQGNRLLLRTGIESDLARLRSILLEVEVAQWWGGLGDEEIREQFIGSRFGYVIEVDEQVIGGIQYSEEDDPMYRRAGIDIFLTAVSHGLGYGTEAVRLLARHLLFKRNHHRITIDPAAANAAAIRTYEKVGFRRVGIMRRYERGPDGTWHDGLLMDLLKDEFIDA